jgi:AcrR family transcriptional regulator
MERKIVMANQGRGSGKVIEFNAARRSLQSRQQWIKRRPTTELGHRVVAATVDEFATKGVQGARVAEIVRRAGTTDPTFYRYFLGLRQAALFVMSEYYWWPLNIRLNHYREVTDDPTKLFDLIVSSLIHSAEDDRSRPWLAESKVFQIVVAESRSPFLLPDAALDTEYVGFLATLEEVVKSGQQQKLFNSDFRPALVATLLVNTLHGLLAQSSVGYRPFRVSEDEMLRVARRIVEPR